MKDYYQHKYQDYYEKTFHVDPASFLNPLIRHIPKGALILDVGCGSGRDLCWFREQGFKVMGFERSKGLATLAQKQARCRIVEGDFETHDFSSFHVDAIVLVGALVHIEHGSVGSVLKNITSGLKKSGKVLVTLKQGEGTYTDDHMRTFYLWQDQELQDIFTRLGYTILDFTRDISKVRTNDIWLGYVLGKTIDVL